MELLRKNLPPAQPKGKVRLSRMPRDNRNGINSQLDPAETSVCILQGFETHAPCLFPQPRNGAAA